MSTATLARVNGDAGLPAPIEDLLDAATEQGAVTFAEVRKALDEAGVGPAEAKRLIRVITDRGITIGADSPGASPAAAGATNDRTQAGGDHRGDQRCRDQ